MTGVKEKADDVLQNLFITIRKPLLLYIFFTEWHRKPFSKNAGRKHNNQYPAFLSTILRSFCPAR
jgi:hypothetical protein